MKEKELEKKLISLWSRNGADYTDNVRRELPSILSALKPVCTKTKGHEGFHSWDEPEVLANAQKGGDALCTHQEETTLQAASNAASTSDPKDAAANAQNCHPLGLTPAVPNIDTQRNVEGN